MSAGVSDPRDLDLTVVRSAARTRQPSARFVRLSQLRKLRECEQVAAVCYRVRRAGIEFLLVQTRGSGRWTFPKGSAEPGLTHAQAAALEAFEEAGVHGRIEEASFARYRRKWRDGENHASRSDKSETVVNAYLCEVFRLSPPQESKRNRTWFSVEDARRRLRDGRNSDDGAELARAVDRAVERIQRLRLGVGIAADRPRQDSQRRDTPKNDPLQKVQFESLVEVRGRGEESSFMPYIRRQLGEMRQSAVPADAHLGEVLQCEVLQFGPSQELNRTRRWLPGVKKAKALGTGTTRG